MASDSRTILEAFALITANSSNQSGPGKIDFCRQGEYAVHSQGRDSLLPPKFLTLVFPSQSDTHLDILEPAALDPVFL
jgi:hypothetical protein